MRIKTRFAPSPTGNLHIGSIRTAFYSWLFARHHGGEFILRIEDTDFERIKENSIKSIFEGLNWLGLNWNQGPYFQSKRLERYKHAINILLNNGQAYKCFCSQQILEQDKKKQILQGKKPRYNGICRNLTNVDNTKKKYVIRFKNPLSGQVVFHDQIRGNIVFQNQELDDLIIQRSNGIPTYNFCVVVDDLDMEITHIIRGEDHINNTPRQINILKAFNAHIPIYAHVSMIFDEKGQKISKRKEAISILEYRKQGILPEALLNYIIRLGWSYGNQEIFSMIEMKKLFSLQSISKSPSIINFKKLLWINKYYLNHLSIDRIVYHLKKYIDIHNINLSNGPNLESIIKLFQNRSNTLQEIISSSHYFYKEFSFLNSKIFSKYLIVKNYDVLRLLYKELFHLENWNSISLLEIIKNISKNVEINIKEINMLIRVVVTGMTNSPSVTAIIHLIGKEKILFRIKKAINHIKKIYL